jgi:hypothetical protein
MEINKEESMRDPRARSHSLELQLYSLKTGRQAICTVATDADANAETTTGGS